MKSLIYSFGFLGAIAVTLASALINHTLAQTTTFTYEEITYTLNPQESRGENLAFTLSYLGSNGNTHTVKYRGSCGTNTIGVLGETVVNSQGRVISRNTAVQAITFDLSSNRDWKMSGVIRQALDLLCNSKL